MKNAYAISSMSRQMCKVCGQIDALAMGIQDTEQGIGDIADVYQELLLDELEHIQMLTLKLTELITVDPSEAHTDDGEGSAFAAGDLTDVKTGDEDGEEGGEEAKK